MEAMLAFISLVLLMFYREREKYPIVETLTLWYKRHQIIGNSNMLNKE